MAEIAWTRMERKESEEEEADGSQHEADECGLGEVPCMYTIKRNVVQWCREWGLLAVTIILVIVNLHLLRTCTFR